MDLSRSRVPIVPARPRRRPEPLPDPSAPVHLPEALAGLLALRHEERMRRAERVSLHPDYLNRVKSQLKTELEVERNLARGRQHIRREIRRVTDPALVGLDRHRVHFPQPTCVTCEIVRPVIWGLGVIGAPFAIMAIFAIVIAV